jgi:hypothetical protein
VDGIIDVDRFGGAAGHALAARGRIAVEVIDDRERPPMRIRWLGATVLLLATATTASAAGPPEWGRSGVYVGVYGVGALENFDVTGFDHAAGYNFRVGYRFNERGAVELAAEHIPSFHASNRKNVELWTATVNLKWIFPYGRWEPYFTIGKGGMVGDGGDADDADLVLRGGLGLQFHFTEHLAGVFEGTYVGPVKWMSDYPYGSLNLGLQYKF